MFVIDNVALRKESVDRNYIIKITVCRPAAVALRKESVDRNVCKQIEQLASLKSLSARRAWIEIKVLQGLFFYLGCRSPQGERG